jgi:ATP-dependent exoDNAse (exonuclease V) beta subunit
MMLGRHGREPTLDYELLGEQAAAAQAREERRLFYVACTRARERLVLSGAARFEPWSTAGCPMGWLAAAFLGEEALADALVAGEGEHAGVRFTFFSEIDSTRPAIDHSGPILAPQGHEPVQSRAPAVGVHQLSYSALAEYQRCGYRFYAERVLRLPATQQLPTATSGLAELTAVTSAVPDLAPTPRGVIVHSLLERLDFRRPLPPGPEAIAAAAGHALEPGECEAIAAMVERFGASELCRRLAAARDVRREQRFAYLLPGDVLITGALDVLARERSGALLIVDYKSDRVVDVAPYHVQQLVYGLAGLRTGAAVVEVVHVFLERPEAPVVVGYVAADAAGLSAELEELARGAVAGEFAVTQEPRRAVCRGCPAEGSLCSWPLSMTRREASDRLF